MARRKTRREEEVMNGSLIAMIDVVFQLIIFFVCTVSMQEKDTKGRIELPKAPNGIPVTSNSDDFRIDVEKNGSVGLSGMPTTDAELYDYVTKAMIQTGKGQELNVVIRGDLSTKHKAIKKVMDVCSRAGIWKIKFVAVKKAVSD
jgi:biopolymer transport protein ExbD